MRGGRSYCRCRRRRSQLLSRVHTTISVCPSCSMNSKTNRLLPAQARDHLQVPLGLLVIVGHQVAGGIATQMYRLNKAPFWTLGQGAERTARGKQLPEDRFQVLRQSSVRFCFLSARIRINPGPEGPLRAHPPVRSAPEAGREGRSGGELELPRRRALQHSRGDSGESESLPPSGLHQGQEPQTRIASAARRIASGVAGASRDGRARDAPLRIPKTHLTYINTVVFYLQNDSVLQPE